MNALKAPNCFSTANEDKLNDLRQKAGNAYQVLGSRGAPPKGRLETLAARGLGTAPTTALSETDSVRLVAHRELFINRVFCASSRPHPVRVESGSDPDAIRTAGCAKPSVRTNNTCVCAANFEDL